MYYEINHLDATDSETNSTNSDNHSETTYSSLLHTVIYPYDADSDADSILAQNIIEEDTLADELYYNEEEHYISYTMTEIDQKYFIATYKYIPTEQFLLFVNKIHVTSFFKYNYNVISRYFFWYSGTFIQKHPPVEIIQLFVMPDSTYVCVIKTYYIKIIQRRWKKIFRERKQYILHRMRLNTLYNYTIGKRNSYYAFPGLKGMLTLSLEK